MDVPFEISQQRIASRGISKDRIEKEDPSFFNEIRQAYIEFASLDPLITTIDASKTFENVELDIVNYVRDHIINPSDAISLVTELSDLLYPESIDADRKNYFTENLLEGFPSYYWTDAWSEYLSSNDDSVVKSRLEALFTALINATEFQLT